MLRLPSPVARGGEDFERKQRLPLGCRTMGMGFVTGGSSLFDRRRVEVTKSLVVLSWRMMLTALLSCISFLSGVFKVVEQL